MWDGPAGVACAARRGGGWVARQPGGSPRDISIRLTPARSSCASASKAAIAASGFGS